jgi:hypothetical protein
MPLYITSYDCHGGERLVLSPTMNTTIPIRPPPPTIINKQIVKPPDNNVNANVNDNANVNNGNENERIIVIPIPVELWTEQGVPVVSIIERNNSDSDSDDDNHIHQHYHYNDPPRYLVGRAGLPKDHDTTNVTTTSVTADNIDFWNQHFTFDLGNPGYTTFVVDVCRGCSPTYPPNGTAIGCPAQVPQCDSDLDHVDVCWPSHAIEVWPLSASSLQSYYSSTSTSRSIEADELELVPPNCTSLGDRVTDAGSLHISSNNNKSNFSGQDGHVHNVRNVHDVVHTCRMCFDHGNHSRFFAPRVARGVAFLDVNDNDNHNNNANDKNTNKNNKNTVVVWNLPREFHFGALVRTVPLQDRVWANVGIGYHSSFLQQTNIQVIHFSLRLPVRGGDEVHHENDNDDASKEEETRNANGRDSSTSISSSKSHVTFHIMNRTQEEDDDEADTDDDDDDDDDDDAHHMQMQKLLQKIIHAAALNDTNSNRNSNRTRTTGTDTDTDTDVATALTLTTTTVSTQQSHSQSYRTPHHRIHTLEGFRLVLDNKHNHKNNPTQDGTLPSSTAASMSRRQHASRTTRQLAPPSTNTSTNRSIGVVRGEQGADEEGSRSSDHPASSSNNNDTHADADDVPENEHANKVDDVLLFDFIMDTGNGGICIDSHDNTLDSNSNSTLGSIKDDVARVTGGTWRTPTSGNIMGGAQVLYIDMDNMDSIDNPNDGSRRAPPSLQVVFKGNIMNTHNNETTITRRPRHKQEPDDDDDDKANENENENANAEDHAHATGTTDPDVNADPKTKTKTKIVVTMDPTTWITNFTTGETIFMTCDLNVLGLPFMSSGLDLIFDDTHKQLYMFGPNVHMEY